MVNKFAIIGISGVVLCTVCLTGAALLGGQALSRAGFDFGGLSKPRCNLRDDDHALTRQIAWDGGDKVEVDVASDIHYHVGQGAMLEVKGPPGVVSQLRVHDGKIALDCDHGGELDITLPGHAFREFTFHGAGDVTLDGIDQPDVKITRIGAGDFTVSGKTGRLEMTMMGAGDVQAGDLIAGTVKLTMMGAGDAEISPTDRLTLTSMGFGDVTLRREPKQIDSNRMGAGDIIHAAN